MERERSRASLVSPSSPSSPSLARACPSKLPRFFARLPLSLFSHLQERLGLPRVRESDESKPPPFHHREVRERPKLGGVLPKRVDRRPVRDAADEELARLMILSCVCLGFFFFWKRRAKGGRAVSECASLSKCLSRSLLQRSKQVQSWQAPNAPESVPSLVLAGSPPLRPRLTCIEGLLRCWSVKTGKVFTGAGCSSASRSLSSPSSVASSSLSFASSSCSFSASP